jgi:hypothetical protein
MAFSARKFPPHSAPSQSVKAVPLRDWPIRLLVVSFVSANRARVRPQSSPLASTPNRGALRIRSPSLVRSRVSKTAERVPLQRPCLETMPGPSRAFRWHQDALVSATQLAPLPAAPKVCARRLSGPLAVLCRAHVFLPAFFRGDKMRLALPSARGSNASTFAVATPSVVPMSSRPAVHSAGTTATFAAIDAPPDSCASTFEDSVVSASVFAATRTSPGLMKPPGQR